MVVRMWIVDNVMFKICWLVMLECNVFYFIFVFVELNVYNIRIEYNMCFV